MFEKAYRFWFSLLVEFFEDPERFQEYMEINFEVAGYEVYASVS